MKKLLASLIVVAALPLIGRADSVTSRLSLTEPDVNSANWGTKLNNNFGLIDAGVGVLGKTNTWTLTNTFQGPVIISSYTTITSSVAFSTITVQSLTATTATITGGTLSNMAAITVSTLTATSSTTLAGALTVRSSATIAGNAEVDGVFQATGSVKLGSSGNSVSISSNAFIGNTTFFASGSQYSISTDTMSVLQLFNQINRYRRPRLLYISGTEVDVETGNNGTSGATTAIFPDGAVYTETQATLLNAVINSTANWGNAQTAGLMPGEKRTNNLWRGFYLVKSTGTTASLAANTTDFVTVISSWMPTQANYSQLNTNFCGTGTNCWQYLGVVPYGDNSGTGNAFVSFKQAGNMTLLSGAVTGNAVTGEGPRLATSASSTGITFTYAAGVNLTTPQLADTIVLAEYHFGVGSQTGGLALRRADGGANVFAMQSAAGQATTGRFWMTAAEGANTSHGAVACDLFIVGYVDGALGLGGNPQL